MYYKCIVYCNFLNLINQQKATIRTRSIKVGTVSRKGTRVDKKINGKNEKVRKKRIEKCNWWKV